MPSRIKIFIFTRTADVLINSLSPSLSKAYLKYSILRLILVMILQGKIQNFILIFFFFRFLDDSLQCCAAFGAEMNWQRLFMGIRGQRTQTAYTFSPVFCNLIVYSVGGAFAWQWRQGSGFACNSGFMCFRVEAGLVFACKSGTMCGRC